MNCILPLLFVVYTLSSYAQVKLPRLISNGMILQRDEKVLIWGWASAGEEVQLELKGRVYHGTTNPEGYWNISLDPQSAGGPYEIIIRGKNEIKISDILFGDVWLCSGQSNMELTMDRARDKYPDIVKSYKNDRIRQFLVPDQYDFKQTHDDLDDGNWVPVTTESIYQFSAVALFFARELYDKYNVPIGIINAALGGSPVEAWMSEDAIKYFPEPYAEFQKFKDDNLIQSIEKKDREISNEWYEKLNGSDPGLHHPTRWSTSEIDDSDWKDIQLPGYWSDNGFKKFNGSAWYRKQFSVPESMIGKPARLWLGRIVDQDSVFINGGFVGTTGYQYPPRKYNVNEGVLVRGKNTLVVRVINVAGKGGFVPDKPYFLCAGSDTVLLSGKWKFKIGAELAELPAPTTIRWKPVGLYNKMISPLTKYRVKGVIWYQGESNADHPENYNKAFTTMITDWRTKFQQPDLPFLYVQLANFMEPQQVPSESKWAELRQAQLNTLQLKNTGMAVAIDLGEWNDIHPLNKRDVGKRLSLLARKIAYSDSILIASGPLPRQAFIKSNKVVVEFENAANGLKVGGGNSLSQFAVSEDGKKFYWAEGHIEGDKVILFSKDVKRPIIVRYAWADNPAGGKLFNKEGLPASPFEINLAVNTK